MKSNNIRIGVVVMSKINGKYYKITNVSIKDSVKESKLSQNRGLDTKRKLT